MLAPFASEQLVVLLLDRCHCRLEGLLVEANPDQHSEVGRVEVGVCQQPSAREDLLDVGPSSSLVAYAKRWSRDSGRSSLRERVLGRDRLASSIHGLEYKYSRMRQTYS